MTLHRRLYKETSIGQTQMWEIHKADDNMSYWTVSGKLNGKMIISAPTAVIPKVNRTAFEQVLLQMDSKVSVQKRRKYVEDMKDIGQAADDALPGYSAMLAKKFADEAHKVVYPCVAQPKLDGVRCLATKDGFFSRGRKPIEACAHIREQLALFFDQFPEARLDGELYSHELKADFEKIIMAVRKSAHRATDEDIQAQKQIKYVIYDVPRIEELDESDPFEERLARFTHIFGHLSGLQSVEVLKTSLSIPSEEELMDVHLRFIKQGYEGTMVRASGMPYEGKRTSNLLKLKSFDEQEYLVIGVNEGKGGLVGHAGAFILQTPDGASFRGKLEGSFERLKYIWEHPDEVIGKAATVRFQGLTNKSSVPRFPVVKCVRGLSEDDPQWV